VAIKSKKSARCVNEPTALRLPTRPTTAGIAAINVAQDQRMTKPLFMVFAVLLLLGYRGIDA
jgi:hypothetical protein